ncbi:hypothetical protein LP420_19460 [Massilia sp. B-10]|nr:hypothetical protein LP420_19460 [Massilia sp. B-10]
MIERIIFCCALVFALPALAQNARGSGGQARRPRRRTGVRRHGQRHGPGVMLSHGLEDSDRLRAHARVRARPGTHPYPVTRR